jgi:hypothetical protein
MEDERRGGL